MCTIMSFSKEIAGQVTAIIITIVTIVIQSLFQLGIMSLTTPLYESP